MPKFLQDDLKLFNGIVSDLFPRIKEEPMDYGEMEASIRKTCIDKGLEDVEGVSNMWGAFVHVNCKRKSKVLHVKRRFGYLHCQINN